MRTGLRRLSPATVALKQAALRVFLKFCWRTGLTRLTIEVIAYTLKSPRATVVNPYSVLTPTEQACMLKVLHDCPHDRVLVALSLGAGV